MKATVKPSMVDQVLAMHRRHYGSDFAVIVQDEHVVPRVLGLLHDRDPAVPARTEPGGRASA